MAKATRLIASACFFACLGLSANLAPASAATLCTVFVDADTGKVLTREGSACDERVTAASTFKIALSAMGFDAGLLKDLHDPAWPFKEGYPDWMQSWRTTTDPSAWMANSVVWYSQQLTRALGEERFGNYVKSFRYGNADVSGDPGKRNGLTRAWISSSLRISPLEQASFLARLVRGDLPITRQARDMTERLIAQSMLAGDWALYGKTGSGAPIGADGKADFSRSYGWFVGWAKKKSRTIVFVRLTQDERKEKTTAGVRTRNALIRELPDRLKGL
ncbi:class D beta-lactamase [Terrihabitans sp. B22-R8]|uniref:class D beta-lactamase n=1 Tax=Terrihabitans sp. B22-R8 TaxID=3425128 RepID=UPI00403C373B